MGTICIHNTATVVPEPMESTTNDTKAANKKNDSTTKSSVNKPLARKMSVGQDRFEQAIKNGLQVFKQQLQKKDDKEEKLRKIESELFKDKIFKKEESWRRRALFDPLQHFNVRIRHSSRGEMNDEKPKNEHTSDVEVNRTESDANDKTDLDLDMDRKRYTKEEKFDVSDPYASDGDSKIKPSENETKIERKRENTPLPERESFLFPVGGAQNCTWTDQEIPEDYRLDKFVDLSSKIWYLRVSKLGKGVQARKERFGELFKIEKTPDYLPRSSQENAVWVCYPSKKAFERLGDRFPHYPSPTTEKNGIYWVLHKDFENVPKGEIGLPVRTQTWNELLNDVDIPKCLPKSPKEGSVWTMFKSYEGYCYSEFSKAMVINGVHWVNYSAKDKAAKNEVSVKGRHESWVSKVGIEKTPPFLPTRKAGYVWRMFPTKDHVPPDVKYNVHLSGVMKDKRYWVCQKRSDCLEDGFGEPMFSVRTRKYSDVLGISILPLYLPRIVTEEAVWTVFPNNEVMKDLPVSCRREEIDVVLPRGEKGVVWVCFRSLDAVVDGEEYFKPRKRPFTDILKVTKVPSDIECKENEFWVVYPRNYFMKNVDFKGLDENNTRKVLRDNCLWCAYTNEEHIPRGERYFSNKKN